jgi:hypothetical protein
MELRNVGTGGELDSELTLMLGKVIILGDPLANLARGIPNDGVEVGVVIRLAPEHLHAE